MASFRNVFPVLTLVFLLFSFSEAGEFLVGGHENSWTIPLPSSSEPLNDWAEDHRFRIGDFLIWKYDSKTESVLQVIEEDYETCNRLNPIDAYSDGNTKVELDRSGPFFFISGAEGHCDKGLKLIVVVMSNRHGGARGLFPVPVPSPAPLPPTPQSGATSLGFGLMGIKMGLMALLAAVLIRENHCLRE
ncbi:Early nodulin-like protein [Quillaja saponaria]|uniref:Early nodulin-like protein n=1 Tax=Quillaja saponaria TaxID=32244 RepID=A0AAD7PI10_QUISA|nr:Early nodulin-like protein [Quillaja saponaria]